MSKENKIIIWIVICLFFVGGIYIVATKKDLENNNIIKIGVIAPLSGNMASLGEGVRNGVLLAYDSIKNTHYKYELIFEDDQLDPKKTASAINKLINIDKVDAVISFTSGSGNVIAPIAETNKIIHFGIANDANIAKGEYNFIHWTPPAEKAKLFVEELKKREIKKISSITLNQQGALATHSAANEYLKKTDIEIVGDELIMKGDTDFKTVILKAQKGNPDIISIKAFSPELELVIKQIKDLGITTPLTSIEAFSWAKNKELLEGSWYVDAGDPSLQFKQLYENTYKTTITQGAPNSYDIIKLLVYAIENVKTNNRPTADEIIKNLHIIKDFSGAMGSLTIDTDGIVVSKADVYEIRDGKQVLLEKKP